MAYQAKSYGRVYHNLYHLVPLYKRAKKDVGKNQASKDGGFQARYSVIRVLGKVEGLVEIANLRQRISWRSGWTCRLTI